MIDQYMTMAAFIFGMLFSIFVLMWFCDYVMTIFYWKAHSHRQLDLCLVLGSLIIIFLYTGSFIAYWYNQEMTYQTEHLRLIQEEQEKCQKMCDCCCKGKQ